MLLFALLEINKMQLVTRIVKHLLSHQNIYIILPTHCQALPKVKLTIMSFSPK